MMKNILIAIEWVKVLIEWDFCMGYCYETGVVSAERMKNRQYVYTEE